MGNILKDHISFIINTGDNSLEATGTQIVFNENDLTINVNGTDYFSFDDHNVSWTVMDEESVIHDYSEDYLTFTALEDTTFTFTQNALQYSLDDGSTWTALAANTASPTVNTGNKILWKQTGLKPTLSNGIGIFSSTGNFEVSGNIMSLHYGDNFIGQIDLSEKNNAFYRLFINCSKLINAENLVLPATTLASNCYANMFHGCTSLVTAPELPATTLAYQCYNDMFCNCTSLTTTPELPATILANYCYSGMFSYCKALIIAPKLPATTLVDGCYYEMFFNCTSLITAPELPTTTLAEVCYKSMFRSCKSLTTAPELPATTLAKECYYGMFVGCTSLITAPELPATTLASNCYHIMFYGCTNLNYIKCFATDISATGCTTEWVKGVASSGTFIKDASMESWTTGFNGIPTGWAVKTVESQINPTTTISTQNYITVKSPESKGYLGFVKLSSVHTLYISEDKQNWELITDVNKLYPINNEVYLCGKLTGNCSTSNYTQFEFISSNIQITGNCNSLWDYENINTTLKQYCGYHMFRDCISLTTAPELPATTLADDCYNGMFWGCTSLTTAPELPATTLNYGCYQRMFEGCTSLKAAPELPATTLANYCYNQMFYNCTSLTTAPQLLATTLTSGCYQEMFQGCISLTSALELPATTLADDCYNNMFHNCTSLTTAPELPATTLADDCYNGMFWGCTSLTIVPEILPATTLATDCYTGMFLDCTSLTVAPELPATTLASWCYYGMFSGCTSLTTAPELPATTLASRCYMGMFEGCTNLTTAPELIAITLTDYCYYRMFDDCTNLNYIKCLATDISAFNCITEWVNGVAASGTFVKEISINSWSRGSSGIPTNWNVYVVGEQDYFTLKTDSGSNGEFNIRKATNKSIDYSINGGINWTTTTATSTIVNASTVMLRSTDKKAWDNGDDTSGITCSINYHVEGNIMSLLYGDDFFGKTNLSGLSNAFYDLFANSSTLTSANKLVLPATTLATSCYQAMFQGCTSLTTAPELPATTLAECCYIDMFSGCRLLTIAPELPATTLAADCYESMFSGCTNLNYIKCLATDISASNCTTNWVNGVASTGTFIKDASMESWTTGNNGIPSEWTIQDYDNSDVTLRIWIDDFPDRTEIAEEYGYDNWADYISDVIYDITNNEDTWNANPYEYTEETFEWNDANYYLWQYNTDLIDEEHYSSSVEYLLTDTIDYNELYERSLDYDIDNYGGIVCFLNSDLETYRGVDFSSEGGRAYPNATSDSIITVEQLNDDGALKIWIDDFSDISVQEMYDNYINDNGGYKQYHLTQDTLTIDNITYYIWESNDKYDYDYNRAYLLTTTNDYDELLSQSLSEDVNNDFTSFGGFLNEDSEESYINGDMRIQYILDVEQDNDDLYIYVDNIKLNGFDDGQTISDYINNPKTLGCNPYKLTSDTIDIDGESYYIWKRTDNIIDDNNVHYLLTTTNDNETLVNTSVESSKYNLAYKLNNCIYAFMGEDNEIYETPSKNVIVKVE